MKYPYELTRDYALKELYTKEQFEWIYISYNYCKERTFDAFMKDLRNYHKNKAFAFEFLEVDKDYERVLFDKGFYLSNKRYWSSVSRYNPNGRTYKESTGAERLTDNMLYANVWLLTDSYLKSNNNFKLKL